MIWPPGNTTDIYSRKVTEAAKKDEQKIFSLQKTHYTSALSAPWREKNTINSRQGAKYAKVFRIKNKIKIEVLGDLSALARNKYDKPLNQAGFCLFIAFTERQHT